MTFLPVVERELRVAARRRGTYWGRFVAAMIGAALAAWILLVAGDTNQKIGADLFMVVSVVVFLYATVAGTLVTCDCLSEEKREGTLGLLFLTDLKGHDVVLGKLAATSVNAFYGMLAVLPMLAIPFILGGVSRAEMLRAVLVAISLLFLFLSIGLFVSALCRKDNWALGLAIFIGLALVGTGPVLVKFELVARPQVSSQLALESCPAVGCFLAFDENYTTLPHSIFWINAAATQLYSWIFFGLACWIVPRSWQDGAIGKKMPWQRKIAPARRNRTRTLLLNANPFLWRVARSGRKRLLVWLTLPALTLMWSRYGRWFSNPGGLLEPGVDLLLLVPAGLILKVWLAAEASRTLSEDRRSSGMELLLTTPLDEKAIVRGQMLALWRQFSLPVAAVLLANLTFVLVEIRRWDFGGRPALLKMHLLLGGFLVADMIALSWGGAWLGLKNRKPNRAALLALTQILVLPCAAFVVLLCLWALVPQRNNTDDSFTGAFVLWLVLGLLADLYFGFDARAKLRAEFRTVVSEGFSRKPPAEPAPKLAPVLAEAQ
jgi:ABC-type transport system involved in multi-copper enzyme maturation permease subunit